METVRMSAKGQIVIPKALRDAHHFHAGTELVVTSVGDEIRLRPAGAIAATRVEDVAGMLQRHAGAGLTDDELEQRIRRQVRAADQVTRGKCRSR